MPPTDPLYNEIDASNLESVRRNVVFNNLFVGTPFQAKLRRAGVWDEFLGGAGMMEGILYGRTQGAAVNPGQTITVTRQQINTGIKFLPKAYATWYPLDDWEMDDGSGTGGVINSGPSMIVDQYQLYMENLVLTMNTMQEMDSFRHGQAASAFITDNRVKTINGLDEALNNGVDPSVYGNVYKSYGGQQRNGNIGIALNSTPIYCGTPTGGTGQIDFAVLMQLWSQCKVTGGSPSLGITNVFGFKAVAIALDAQRRDISNTRHDIKWDGLNFNGVDIYADPLAPSAQAQNYIALGSGAGGGQGNASLVDGVGSSTTVPTITTPQFTNPTTGAPVPVSPTGSGLPSNQTIAPGEVLYFLEPESFKIRPTNKKGWNFGLRRAPMPNNVSIDALFMRLGINLYNTQPRHNCYAFAFSS
jgi:hypothetical protein